MDILAYSLSFILLTSLIGIYLSRNVHTVKGYAVADRSLPFFISTATVFATWFGAEAILGIPESFMKHGLAGVISDPIGAFLCLIVLGVFFARRYYNMNVITIVDFFYNRYGKIVEIIAGLAIGLSYVGWIAAQFIAFGSVFAFMLNGAVTVDTGIMIGAAIIVVYTFKGGMVAVAINDFMQTIIIAISLIYTLFLVANMAGGFSEVYQFAVQTKKTSLIFDAHYPNYTYIFGVLLSMILGTIPQQDTFQRITSAKSANVAVNSTIFGGCLYLLITLIPIFIVLAATKLEVAASGHIPENFDLYIAQFIIKHVPKTVQIFFFGSLFGAILSTASGTILATSVVLSRNVLGEFFPKEANLLVVRLTLVLVTFAVCLFAIFSENSIHQLVEDSGKVTMVIVFFPLILGMFWKKTSYAGVVAGMLLSTTVWLSMISYQNYHVIKLAVAPELIGFVLSFLTIFIGSILFPDSRALKLGITHDRHISDEN